MKKEPIGLKLYSVVLTAVLFLTPAPEIAVAQSHLDDISGIYLIIRFQSKIEKLDEFSSIMSSVAQDMATEPGFESAIVYENVDDPTVFTLVELWESRQAHEIHFRTIVDSGDWAHIRGLLQGEPVMGYFEKR